MQDQNSDVVDVSITRTQISFEMNGNGVSPQNEVDAGLTQLLSELDFFHANSVVNTIAGNKPNGGWAEIDRQFGIMLLEFKELAKAIRERDIDGVRDGIADVVFTAAGVGFGAGLNSHDDYVQVCIANSSRFDSSIEDAIRTQEKYAKLGVSTYVEPVEYDGKTYFITKSAHDQTGNNGEFYPYKKWLKSYAFHEPRFQEIPANVVAKLEETAGIECRHAGEIKI